MNERERTLTLKGDREGGLNRRNEEDFGEMNEPGASEPARRERERTSADEQRPGARDRSSRGDESEAFSERPEGVIAERPCLVEVAELTAKSAGDCWRVKS